MKSVGRKREDVESSGLFELRLKYFKNDNGRDNTGVCCSGRSDSVTGKCIGTCKTRFRVCLKHYQAKIDTTSQCTFGDVMTPVLGENTINMTSQSQQIGFVNPIQFPFDFAWPKCKRVKMEELGLATKVQPC
uniref:Notch ligand N-terminal domain-containing protein n=1 Tax=Lutzomyia longipalpis TaxID=7200 RepID=A0A1B0CSW0_LUTLO